MGGSTKKYGNNDRASRQFHGPLVKDAKSFENVGSVRFVENKIRKFQYGVAIIGAIE
jgi:hypothetical protein